MNIEDIIKGKGKTLFTVKTKTTAFDAVSVLDKERVGVLLVLDEKDNVAGILSERDVLYKCYNSGKKLEEQTVENLMTNVEDIIVGKLDDTPQQLMNIMTNQRIRHIPIIENGNIVGIVSIGDLIKLVLENSEIESRKLREYIKNPFGIHIYSKES
jgi:CBS domain-containing protein